MGLEPANTITKYYPRLKPEASKPSWTTIPRSDLATLPYYVPTDDPEAGFDTIQEAQNYLMANLDKIKAKHYSNAVLSKFDIIAVTVVSVGTPPTTIAWNNV